MAKKITIVVPDSVFDKVEPLRSKLECSTMSGIFSLGIEILNWTASRRLDGYEVHAEKVEESMMTIERCPLLIPKK